MMETNDFLEAALQAASKVAQENAKKKEPDVDAKGSIEIYQESSFNTSSTININESG